MTPGETDPSRSGCHSRTCEWFLAEVVFIFLAIAIYWEPIQNLFVGGPPEVSLTIAHSLSDPLTDMTLWGAAFSASGTGVLPSYAILSVVGLVILLTSSYLLLDTLLDPSITSRDSSGLRTLIRCEVLLPAIVLSTSPLFVTNYIGFGFDYFAWMNLALWAVILATKSTKLSFVTLAGYSGAIFSLTIGAIEYPLVLPYFIVIVAILAAFHPGLAKRRWRLISNGAVVLAISAVSGASLLSTFTSALGFPSPQEVQPSFHVVNLFFYDAIYRYGPVLPSLLGQNIAILPFWDSTTTLVLSTLFLGVLFGLAKKALRQPVYWGLLSVFFVLTLLNLNVSSGSTSLGLLVTWLVATHVVTYDKVGILFTVVDLNRIVLVPLWYTLAAMTSLALVTPREYLILGSARTGAKSIELPAVPQHFKLVPSRSRLSARWMTVVAASIAMIVLCAAWGGQLVSKNALNPSTQVHGPAFAYMSGSTAPSYDQQLLLSTASGFTSPFIVPSANVMAPQGNAYPFYENVLRLQGSPALKTVFGGFPASTYVSPDSEPSPYLESVSLKGGYQYSQNWNVSNVIAGSPVFVVGPAASFDTFEMSNSVSSLNGTAETLQGPNSSVINYLSVPQANLAAWNQSYAIDLNFDVQVSTQPLEYYYLGLATNSSNPHGYGPGNEFVGVVVGRAGNLTYGEAQYNLGKWRSSGGEIPLGPPDTSFNFTIIVTDNGGVSDAYVGFPGKWVYLGSGFDLSLFRYITMHSYKASPQLVSFTVNVESIRDLRNTHWLPIFYDSFFSTGTAFLSALNDVQQVMLAPGYGVEDLALSELTWSGESTVLHPAAYAIQQPSKGWFQAFSSNPPQGALYAEGINGVNLPVQWGYGSDAGYAESTVVGSKFLVPLPSTDAGTDLAVNALFSPAGGRLEVWGNGFSYNLTTTANGSQYRWVTMSIPPGVSSVGFTDGSGFESVNLVQVVTASQLHSVDDTVKTILSSKTLVSLDAPLKAASVANVSGFYNMKTGAAEIGVTGASASVLLEFPVDVDFGAELSVTSGIADLNIVPVWGSFLGVLAPAPDPTGFSFMIHTATFPLVSDTVVILSGAIALAGVLQVVSRRLQGIRSRAWRALLRRIPPRKGTSQ